MAFLSECLFCKKKVRVSDRALGQSITCPRCGSSFTLAPMANPPPEVQLRKAPVGAAGPTTDAKTAPPPAPKPVKKIRLRPAQVAAVLSTASLLLAGAGLACAFFPPLRLVTLALGAVAAAGGAWALLALPLRPRTSAAAVLLGVPVVLIAAFWPYLLVPWLQPRSRPTSLSGPPRTGPVVAVPFDEKETDKPSQWIDARKFAAGQGGLRVGVLSAVVQPVYSSKATKEQPVLLHVQLNLSNATAEQDIAYIGWGGGDKAAVLRDDKGREYKAHPEASPGGGRRFLVIEPQDSIGETLLFDPPPESVEYLRLELPAAAANGEGVYRFQIPKEMIEFPRRPTLKPPPEEKR
jgi:hypothetical protein